MSATVYFVMPVPLYVQQEDRPRWDPLLDAERFGRVRVVINDLQYDPHINPLDLSGRMMPLVSGFRASDYLVLDVGHPAAVAAACAAIGALRQPFNALSRCARSGRYFPLTIYP